MSQLEVVQKAVSLAKTRGLKKQCIACAKKGIDSQMILDIQENWYKCHKCKGVRPIDTDVPLYWNYCPNSWYDDTLTKLVKIGKNIHKLFKCIISKKKFSPITFTTWCLYPKLITQDQKGIIKIKCVNCGHEYVGA